MAKDLRFEIRIPVQSRALVGSLNELERRQLPFAVAVTLSRTAETAQNAFRKKLRRTFTIRSPRVPKGIQHIKARKSDWPHPVATVGTRDEFIARFEKGGVQRPTSGSRFAIPTRLAVSRRSATGKIPKNFKPKQIIAAKKAFEEDSAIKRRVKTRRFRLQARHLEVLYLLRKRIRIKGNLGMLDSVGKTVDGVIAKHFEREFTAAVKSARAQPGRFTSSEGRFFYLRALRQLGFDPRNL